MYLVVVVVVVAPAKVGSVLTLWPVLVVTILVYSNYTWSPSLVITTLTIYWPWTLIHGGYQGTCCYTGCAPCCSCNKETN